MQQTKPRKTYFSLIIYALFAATLFLPMLVNAKSGREKKSKFITKSPVFELRKDKVTTYPTMFNSKIQNSISQKLVSGEWSFVFVGYTSCPDVCPMTLSLLSQVFKNLEGSGKVGDNFKALFVSVDFDKISQDDVSRYAKHFHSKNEGVASSREETDKFLKWMGASYKRTGKLISHSTSVFLVSPQGELIGEFVNPRDSKKISNKFIEIYKKHKSKIEISNFKASQPIPGSPVIAGFLDIRNNSEKDVNIEKITCSDVEDVEIHEMSVNQKTKMMEMVKLDVLTIPKNTEIKLESGGLHLMIYLKSEKRKLKSLNCFIESSGSEIMAMHGRVGNET